MYPMYYGFGMDPAYLALVIISLVLGGLTPVSYTHLRAHET